MGKAKGMMTAPSKIESVEHAFTGVIPAEPGWRVVLTNGKDTYIAPVVGWAWERHVWKNGDGLGLDIDPIMGEPIIVTEDGCRIASVSDVLTSMAAGSETKGLIAPGRAYGGPNADGWVQVKTQEET